MIHILPAAKDEVAAVLNAAKTRKPVEWLVSKGTHEGDQAIFYLPDLGLAARGVIGTEPEDRGQGFGYGRYTATVRKIARLDRSLSLDVLRKKSSILEMALRSFRQNNNRRTHRGAAQRVAHRS